MWAQSRNIFLWTKRFLKSGWISRSAATPAGRQAPKGQELEDHTTAASASGCAASCGSWSEELWALGVPAKTEHNEVAPVNRAGRVYSAATFCCDHNQIMMS